MNWKPLPLALAAVLMVSTGCSSLLTRDYAWVEPHSDTPVSAGDSDTLRVDSYQALVNALVYLVDKGADSNEKAMEMAQCIIENGREELQTYYPIALYDGEETDAANISGNPKVFDQPLTVDLLEQHQKISEECK